MTQPVAAPVTQQVPARLETPLSVMESEASLLAQLHIIALGTLSALTLSISPFGGALFGTIAYVTGKLTHSLANLGCVNCDNIVIKIGKYVLTLLASISAAVLVTTALGIVPLTLPSIAWLTLGTIGPFVALDLSNRAVEYFLGPRSIEPVARSYNPWQATFI